MPEKDHQDHRPDNSDGTRPGFENRSEDADPPAGRWEGYSLSTLAAFFEDS